MSTLFATCLSSNLSFSMEFATFWCSNCPWNMVVCNQGSFRVGSRPRVSLGFLSGFFFFALVLELGFVQDLFRVGFEIYIQAWFKSIQGQFRVHLGLVLGFTQAWFKIIRAGLGLGLVLGCIQAWLRSIQGWFRIHLYKVGLGFIWGLVCGFMQVCFQIYVGLVEELFRLGLGGYFGLVQDLSRIGLGPIQGWFKVCLGVVLDLFRPYLRSRQGWFKVYLGLV